MGNELSERLATRLANFKLKDDVIKRLADGVIVEGLDIKRFDVCAYGICIDYFTPRMPKLDGLLGKKDLAHLEVFPYGILNPDYFHVRVGYKVDELQGAAAGFQH